MESSRAATRRIYSAPPTPPQGSSPSKTNPKPGGGGRGGWASHLTLQNLLITLFALLNIGLSIWVVVEHGYVPELLSPRSPKNGGWDGRPCELPPTDPYSNEIRSLARESTQQRIDCAASANSDFGGRVHYRSDVNGSVVRISGANALDIPCCYRPFFRVSDAEVWVKPTKDRGYECYNLTDPSTPIHHEFIELICDDKKKIYRDAFPFVHKKEEVEERVGRILKEEDYKEDKLSVILIGLDSTSKQNFMRMMPRSAEYMEKAGGVLLQGYGRVGGDRLSNIVPLLSGLGLEEWKELCVRKDPPMSQAIHLDACPFIWNYFKGKGYRTFFAEDGVTTDSIFNSHYSHAFLNPPTDYYLRPFSFRILTAHNIWDGFCFGPRKGMEVLMEYLHKGVVKFPLGELIFHFTWASVLPKSWARLHWGDALLERTLQSLESTGKLNQSALVLLSEGGSGDSRLRAKWEGQLEEKQALGFILLPPWFSKKYPRAAGNLRANAPLLTSPYDLHETLKDLAELGKLNDPHLHYTRQRRIRVAEHKGMKRGTSLFTQLPTTRGCASAGIPLSHCLCFKKKKLSTASWDVRDAVAFVIGKLKDHLLEYKNICIQFKLDKVLSALRWSPDDEVVDSWNGNPEENYKRISVLQINFTADTRGQPSSASPKFTAVVLFDPDSGWKFTDQVIRLDKPDQVKYNCGPLRNPVVKQACICKEDHPRGGPGMQRYITDGQE